MRAAQNIKRKQKNTEKHNSKRKALNPRLPLLIAKVL